MSAASRAEPAPVAPAQSGGKATLAAFLASNPFSRRLTDGLFYGEKMRAVHRVAPDAPIRRILEVGGGQSGLSALLYPEARIVNLDLDPSYARSAQNHRLGVEFVCGDATRLPFPDGAFDAVTMFDLLEHVPDDAAAAQEALRVLRPGGVLLVSTPREHWRYPWYRWMAPLCPDERELFARWGHVRRGYSLERLAELFNGPPEARASFINPLTALAHDIAFSRLGHVRRLAVHLLAAPLSLAGWWLHEPLALEGTEIAARWRKAG
jgi:SAM-dependent methyltransferase